MRVAPLQPYPPRSFPTSPPCRLLSNRFHFGIHTVFQTDRNLAFRSFTVRAQNADKRFAVVFLIVSVGTSKTFSRR